MRVVVIFTAAFLAAGVAPASPPVGNAPLTCVHPPRFTWEDFDPSWSPSGSRIAFVRRGNGMTRLFVASQDGTQPRAVGTATADPAWATEGTLVFEREGVIWDLELATGRERSLVEGFDPDVTRAGASLVFTRDRAIWVASADGSDARPLSVAGSHFDREPAWSPDGRRIAFTRLGGGTNVWLMDADGGNARQLTRNGYVNVAPAWHADGARLTFETRSGGNSSLRTIRADGTGDRSLTRITDTAFDASRSAPSWQPAGLIAFVAQRAGDDGWGSEIRLMNSTSRSGEWRLTYHCQFGEEHDRWNVINGTALVDVIYGYAGNDVIRGLANDDRLYGGADEDRIDGGLHDDRIDGALGNDLLLGGPGNDTLLAKDGQRDVLDCGPGRDVARADRLDAVRANCEHVHRSLPQPRH